ncbi:glycosyl transferase family 2, partial [Rhodococcus sp. JT-3]|uniref:glycosyl transferase family 2 n=1 Tax=Rhodococcus sp. JT-3 TaxID=1973213 RepID=UPI00130360AF
GGEEGYIHEKFRINGGKVVCLPAFGWHHRFERPAGVPYRINWEDRVHNYLLGWSEVGWDLDSLHRQFSRYLGDSYPEIRRRAELSVQRPELAVGGVMVLSDDRRIAPWRSCLGEAESIELTLHRVLAPEETPDPWRLAGAFVAGLDKAILLGWNSVVFVGEEHVVDRALPYKLRNLFGDLADQVDVAVVHTRSAAVSDYALILRRTAFQRLRDTLARMIAKSAAAEFSLPLWLLSEKAIEIVLDYALTPLRSSAPEPVVVEPDTKGKNGAVVINLDVDIDRWKAAWHRFIKLPGISVVERMSAFEDITNPEAAFMRSWRRAIARAAENTWDSVLIAADDVSLLDASGSILDHARTELDRHGWDMVQLGHDPKSRDGALLDGLTLLRFSPQNRGVHAVLVHSRAFERILEAIPDPETDPAAFGTWAGHYQTLGDFLVDAGTDDVLTCWTLAPGIASTRSLIRAGAMESTYSRRFTL